MTAVKQTKCTTSGKQNQWATYRHYQLSTWQCLHLSSPWPTTDISANHSLRPHELLWNTHTQILDFNAITKQLTFQTAIPATLSTCSLYVNYLLDVTLSAKPAKFTHRPRHFVNCHICQILYTDQEHAVKPHRHFFNVRCIGSSLGT